MEIKTCKAERAGMLPRGVVGMGEHLALRSLTPPVTPAVFFESKKMMKAKNYNRRPRLPAICAECGDELALSRSGHQICANSLCRDGFDVGPDWRLTPPADVRCWG